MATYTPNIDLKKPAQSDKIRIADLNGNADNIDAALGADFGVSNKPSVDDAVNSLGAGLAIISNGDIHAAITAGQYVYVRGHGTLTEGLYVATANVSQNGALTGSNVDAVSGGGLNALNSKLPILYSKGAVTAREFYGISGFLTTSATYLALYVPIILSPDVTDITNISITNAGIRISEGGYVVGNGADLTQYVIGAYVFKLQGLVRIDLEKSGGWGFTNNSICIGNATLSFTLS